MSSRTEDIIQAILDGETVDFEPQSRAEAYLLNCAKCSGTDGLPAPQSRLDALLLQLAEKMAESGGSSGGGSSVNEVVIHYPDKYGLYDTAGNQILPYGGALTFKSNYASLPFAQFITEGQINDGHGVIGLLRAELDTIEINVELMEGVRLVMMQFLHRVNASVIDTYIYVPNETAQVMGMEEGWYDGNMAKVDAPTITLREELNQHFKSLCWLFEGFDQIPVKV